MDDDTPLSEVAQQYGQSFEDYEEMRQSANAFERLFDGGEMVRMIGVGGEKLRYRKGAYAVGVFDDVQRIIVCGDMSWDKVLELHPEIEGNHFQYAAWRFTLL